MSDLTPEMQEALQVVQENEGIGAAQVAECCAAPRTTMHRILNALEKQGFIETHTMLRPGVGVGRVRACYIAGSQAAPAKEKITRPTGRLRVAEKIMSRLSSEPVVMEDFLDILAERGIVTTPAIIRRELKPYAQKNYVEYVNDMEDKSRGAGLRLTSAGEAYLEERWQEQEAK